MMRCWSRSLEYHVRPWVRDYDKLHNIAIVLIYIQIACALVGSLGALYNGVLLINLAIALFALVAIESNSQSLGRTYAGLLFGAILLDFSWFILFTHDIWNISPDSYGIFFIFSVKLALAMEIIGFSVRLSSAFIWIQIYRLGVSGREADFASRSSLLSPATPPVGRESSESEDILGGSIYDPAHYYSLFQENQENGYSFEGQGGCTHSIVSVPEVQQLKKSNGESFQAMDPNISYMLRSWPKNMPSCFHYPYYALKALLLAVQLIHELSQKIVADSKVKRDELA